VAYDATSLASCEAHQELAPLCGRISNTSAYTHTGDAQPFQYGRQRTVTIREIQPIGARNRRYYRHFWRNW